MKNLNKEEFGKLMAKKLSGKLIEKTIDGFNFKLIEINGTEYTYGTLKSTSSLLGIQTLDIGRWETSIKNNHQQIILIKHPKKLEILFINKQESYITSCMNNRRSFEDLRNLPSTMSFEI